MRRRLGHRDRIGGREGLFQSFFQLALEHFFVGLGFFAGDFVLLDMSDPPSYAASTRSAASRSPHPHIERALAAMGDMRVLEADHQARNSGRPSHCGTWRRSTPRSPAARLCR